MNKNRRNLILLVAGSFILSWLMFMLPHVNELNLKVNDTLFSYRYRIFGPQRVSPYIVHVDIDDSSLQQLDSSIEGGERYARIIDILSEAEVSGIIFDIVFLKHDGDTAFDRIVEAADNSKRVYFPVILDLEEDDGSAPASKFSAAQLWRIKADSENNVSEYGVKYITAEELVACSRGVGHINNPPDPDGIYRRSPLLYRSADGYVPSISFRAVCDYLEVSPDNIDVDFGRHIVLHDAVFPDGRTKDISIPIDSKGRIIINFVSRWGDEPPNAFSHYSLVKLFELQDGDEIDYLMDDIEESLVVVANVGAGLDRGAVPIERNYRLPGIHSTVMDSILREDFLRELSPGWELLVSLMLAVMLVLLSVRFHARWFALTTAVLFVLAFLSGGFLFMYMDTMMNVARPLLGIVISLIVVNGYKYMAEEKEKAYLRARFENYFAPSLLNKILRSPAMLDIREKKVVTILFSDIAGFTAWSSANSPEVIHGTLNRYFEAMSAIVFKYGGTIDKYIGDGLMVFFGDPEPYPDHALRAVRAAIEMQQKTRELREEWTRAGGMNIRIRVGINTGEALVGNMGSQKRVDYTVIGAHVNLAARLESGAPIDGVLISTSTQAALEDALVTRPAGTIKAKGFAEPVEVYEVDVS